MVKSNVMNILGLAICSFAAGVQAMNDNAFWFILALAFAMLNAFILFSKK